MKSILFFLALHLLCKLSIAKLQLGDLIPLCNANDPNLNACVVNSANQMIPILSKGIRELGFPPLDPLQIPKMHIEQSDQPISISLTLTDTVHKGLSTMKFYAASIDLAQNRWVLNATLPDYSVTGNCEVKGQIFVLPIIGHGKAEFSYGNTGVDFVLYGTPRKQNGAPIFDLNKLKVYFTFNKSQIYISDLINGNQQLGTTISEFIKNNSNEVNNGLKGSLEDVYSSLYFGLIKKLIHNVPYSELFQSV